MINNIYCHHTGRSYEEVYNALERDNFMSAEDAKKFGLVDEIITKRADTIHIEK